MARIRTGLLCAVMMCAACTDAAGSVASNLRSVAPGGGSGGKGILTVPGEPAPGRGPAAAGVDLLPIHIPEFIFGVPTRNPQIQAGSTALLQLVGSRRRLDVTALPSASGTAAMDFLEHSPPGHRWGEVMFPAERAVFRAFAANRGLGDMLVVLTDVDVVNRPDPIPLTAYMWGRQDVEAYAVCGIPNRAIDDCTQAFYALAREEIVNAGAILRGA